MIQASPVQVNERSEILDILRGFALLGICLANSGYFSMFIFQSPERLALFPYPLADQWLKYFHIGFVDGKFYSIFSMLFGVGFSIIFYGRQGRSAIALFYRRLSILFALGLLHALFIWDGDILMFYALSGALLPLFRNFKPKTLIIVAVFLILSPILFDIAKIISNNALNLSKPFLAAAMQSDKAAGITEAKLYNWLIINDSYQDLLTWNQSGFWWSWQMRIDGNRIPKIFAMFLIGLAVGKLKLYARIEDYKAILKKIMIWAFVIGISSGIAKVIFEMDKISLPEPAGLFDTAAYALNVAPLAIGYCIAIGLLHNQNSHRRLFAFIAPVGRMALTNYIMQSIICISIYYGIGAGVASRVGPSFFVPVAFGIFAFQIIISKIWLNHFNFGPLEWIWRMLTYGKTLPLRKS